MRYFNVFCKIICSNTNISDLGRPGYNFSLNLHKIASGEIFKVLYAIRKIYRLIKRNSPQDTIVFDKLYCVLLRGY